MRVRIGLLVILLLAGCGSVPQGAPEATTCAEASLGPETGARKLYFGDLHNHNSVGQIQGSLERTFEIAQSHLDFFAFTPQSQWPDMREIPGGRNAQFERGFKAVRENWAKIQELTAKVNKPGEFVSLLGYEVHYNEGDFNIIYPGAGGELVHLKTIKEWQDHARRAGAILIPHHPAYLPYWRGWDWSRLDPSVSPVVEMMSEHGNAESDRSPIRYIRHSLGGRYTKSTVQSLWKSGVRTGVIASSDDHLGYPGAYGEGLAAVWADDLTRESIMEAIKARRTYAVNADRIELDFKLNGRWMGESAPGVGKREMVVSVKGEDVIDRVEILRNNQVIQRVHPVDREPGEQSWKQPVLLRIEYGWGPWAAFDMARTADWRFQVGVKGGKLLSVSPHFQSRPFDEERRDKVGPTTGNSFELVSYTSRLQAYEEKPTKDVVLAIEGSPATEITVTFTAPARLTFSKTLGELAESNDVMFTGEFSSESAMFHRVVFADNYRTHFSYTDEASAGDGWYQVRVAQTNGSYAWSSPIWVGRR